MGCFKNSFTEEMENTLIIYMLELESHLFGVTFSDLRVLGYKLAEWEGFHQQFNTEKQIASEVSWWSSNI